MLCKTKNVKRQKLKRLLLFTIIIFVLLIVLFELQAIPFTKKCVKKQSKTISAQIVSRIIENVQNKAGCTYSDLAEVIYSKDGKVTSISENTVYVNKLKSRVTRGIQNELDKRRAYSFKLPIGSFTDITLLNSLGPEVEINFILTGSVSCKLKSTFESGGVNQTVHHIRLIVKTEIITISPEYSGENTYTTDYEIAQTVIVGETPSTFADIVR